MKGFNEAIPYYVFRRTIAGNNDTIRKDLYMKGIRDNKKNRQERIRPNQGKQSTLMHTVCTHMNGHMPESTQLERIYTGKYSWY
jgi:hypothetical protein